MLRNPDMQPLRALGFLKAVIKHCDHTTMKDICEVLKDIQNSYPTLFTNLGKLKTEYIKIKPVD